MHITKEVIQQVVKLAGLQIGDAGMDALEEDFNKVLNFVDSLNEVELDETIEPLFHPIELKNNTRDDVVQASLPNTSLSKIAPKFEAGFFVVPQVIKSK